MKRFLLPSLAAATLFAQTPAPSRSVYIFPMAGGLDQYLAEQLTRTHVIQVVANPKVADLVLTDKLGEAFEQQLEKVRPLPKPPEPAETKEDGKDSKTKIKDDQKEVHFFQGGTPRGTVFLVDAQTRAVLWSDYEASTRGGPDHRAALIAKKLQSFGK